jgi:hypothetical protein
MQQTAQSYLFICIFNNFFKLFEDFVDTLHYYYRQNFL